MRRLLDIDLDFFVHGAAHWRASDGDRLEEDAYPSWSIDDVAGFLSERCGLTEPLPGFVVEHHGEALDIWRHAFEVGTFTAPLDVTHVDAHADLGFGDAGFVYLMTELLHQPVEERCNPKRGSDGLGDGNWLAFAAACRWVGDLTYVFNEGGGDDLLRHHMEDFDTKASNLQLKRVDPAAWERVSTRIGANPDVAFEEPRIPIKCRRWDEYETDVAFDAISLCRSPGFTPASSDEIFDWIRENWIEEARFATPRGIAD